MSLTAPARPRVWRWVATAAAVSVVPLGVIVTGMGSASAAATVFESEDATLSQAVVATNHPGFTGTGFADYNAVAGSYVEFTVGTSTAGMFLARAAGEDRPDHVDSQPRAVITRARPP